MRIASWTRPFKAIGNGLAAAGAFLVENTGDIIGAIIDGIIWWDF